MVTEVTQLNELVESDGVCHRKHQGDGKGLHHGALLSGVDVP